MPQVSKRGCLARSAGLLTTIETVHSSQVQLRSREAQAHDTTTKFDHCEDAYRCRQEYRQCQITFDSFFTTILYTKVNGFSRA